MNTIVVTIGDKKLTYIQAKEQATKEASEGPIDKEMGIASTHEVSLIKVNTTKNGRKFRFFVHE